MKTMSFDYETGIRPGATPFAMPRTEEDPEGDASGGEGQSEE
jgi:hypothetical protein